MSRFLSSLRRRRRQTGSQLDLLNEDRSSTKEMENCPDCQTRSVLNRFTLQGLLYGIFCFPCGIYCCLKRRQQFCSKCHCEVINTQPNGLSAMGYNFRSYQANQDDSLSVEKSVGYRNAALSISANTTNSDASSADMYGSQNQLITKQPL